jgi:hypothetical protein
MADIMGMKPMSPLVGKVAVKKGVTQPVRPSVKNISKTVKSKK